MKKHGRWVSSSSTACLLISVVLVGLLNIFIGHWSAQSVLTGRSTAAIQNAPPPLPTKASTPSKSSCVDGAKIYHIGIADIEGGVGTALYQLVINQLLYAERYNLTPWVHLLPNVSKVIDDPSFSDHGKPLRLNVQAIGEPEALRGGPHRRHIVPGPPVMKKEPNTTTTTTTLTIPGDGIWKHYFHPVVSTNLIDPTSSSSSCRLSSYVTTSLSNIHLIIPGLHGFDGIRCWRYDYLPEYVRRPHQSWTRWIADSRRRAAPLVERYIRPLPALQERARRLVVDRNSNNNNNNNRTLGLHIRHSDKAAGRRVVGTAEFLPFAKAFVDAGGQHIYVATDSSVVTEEIRNDWPPDVASKVQDAAQMIRSSGKRAVFDTGDHHRTNMEAIVEILALSRCSFLIHGHSAMSEAAIWTNPQLHFTAINLEDEHHLDTGAFTRLMEMEKEGVAPEHWPKAVHMEEDWIDKTYRLGDEERTPTHNSCRNVNGVLWIRSVLEEDTTASAFFESVLVQVAYAEKNNWKPWIHLTYAPLIYDPVAHGGNTTRTFAMMKWLNENRTTGTSLQKPTQGSLEPNKFVLRGNGIWNKYFEPISDFEPGDSSCTGTPLMSMREDWIRQILSAQDRPALGYVTSRVRFRPYLLERSAESLIQSNADCLGIHMQLTGKRSTHKRKATEFLQHMEAYVRAGGTCIYLVTDTARSNKYIMKNFPRSITSIIQTQGDNVVRSEKGDWPPHLLDAHHRVNAEALVDMLALSRCKLLVHTNSSLSQAVINLNHAIQSVNIVDRDNRMSPLQFEKLCRFSLGVDKELHQVPNEEQGHHAPLIDPRVVKFAQNRTCRSKAIAYLAQKRHSSYGRDSYSNLLRSIDLLNRNYLATNSSHMESLDIFIFHTGDFNHSDIAILEGRLTQGAGLVQLVDLSQTKYWARPEHQVKDRPEDWYAWPLFSEGYRRMMHWFAIDIWDFFDDYNTRFDCAYRYILRLDEDSFIHSPIKYDLFDFMENMGYVYGFRMCAYEMQVTQRMSKLWQKRHTEFLPERKVDLEMCGFYNNFFIADLDFFKSARVSSFLRFIDRQGHIYRRRLGDLMIHSMAVYWFAPQSKIYRFLDFTYEHSTLNTTDGCMLWGAIQAGYDDQEASKVSEIQKEMMSRGCATNSTVMTRPDLSPSYSHIKHDVRLRTISAGRVEVPQKGILSG